MIVEGFKIEEHVIEKVTVWAVTQLHFTYGELQGQLRRAGVEEDAVYRGADRILQKWKKDGKIMFRKSQWHWQGGIK